MSKIDYCWVGEFDYLKSTTAISQFQQECDTGVVRHHKTTISLLIYENWQELATRERTCKGCLDPADHFLWLNCIHTHIHTLVS